MNINFDDYISAGYYITTLYDDTQSRTPPSTSFNLQTPQERYDKWLELIGIRNQILPDTFYALSNCAAAFIPDVGWELRKTDPFQISPDILPTINKELEKRFSEGQVGHTRTWYSLEDAQDFLAKFGNHIQNTVLLGAGLQRSLLEDFFEESRAFHLDATHPKNGGYIALEKQLPFAQHGDILGYEVMGYEYDIGHSMFCYYLVEETYRRYQIKPNQYGLYNTFEEAEKCAYYANCDNGNKDGSSVGDCAWYPLLIVHYPISKG